jgi:hypothetical protein
MIDHLAPFHCSANASVFTAPPGGGPHDRFELQKDPTATHDRSEVQSTAEKPAMCSHRGMEVRRTDHVEPFHRHANVPDEEPPGPKSRAPTATQNLGDGHDTPDR